MLSRRGVPHAVHQESIRIAFFAERVDDLSRGYASGVCRFASPKRGMITRDFFFDSSESFRSIVAWEPHAVVCFVVEEVMAELRDQIPPHVPIVNTARTPPMPGVAVVLASAAEFYRQAHLIFDRLEVKQVWQFVFGGEPTGQIGQQMYREFAENWKIDYHSQWAPEPESLLHLHQLEKVDPEVEAWLRRLPKPVGVFSQNTLAGCYLARTCELMGLKVPDDVAIIGADGFQVATATHPPVTSIVAPVVKIGSRAVELAIEMLQASRAPCDIVVVEGFKIHERASTGVGDLASCDIDAALRFIELHACEGIQVNDVVEQTQGVSRVTFHKRFLEAAGITPATAIQERRMREARWLLSQTDIAPGTICGLCGFRDYLHFYKVFRTAEGVCPTQFRKLAR